MTYCIFIKSIRILEEFRKNLHIKIPHKSCCANFQSLGNFQNSYFIQNGIFPGLWLSPPSRPSGLCGPRGPASPGRCPSSSSSWPSATPTPRAYRCTGPPPTSNPWRADQWSTPPSIPRLTQPPRHLHDW
jgi:hypothetical protein